MPQGTIKKIMSEKGFGFITGSKGDLFFHHSAVTGGSFESLTEGQEVDYEMLRSRRFRYSAGSNDE